MGKRHKQSTGGYYNFGSSFHGTAQHKAIPCWEGTIQATNGDDLKKNFKNYDLCLFLEKTTGIPEGMPFALGAFDQPVEVKNRMIIYTVADRHAPESDPYWIWVRGTIIEALKKGQKVGIACMGGHGRTGTVIATIYGRFLGAVETDGVPKVNPIVTVRNLVGCNELVESVEQEDFVYEQTGFPPPMQPLASDLVPKQSHVPYSSDEGKWWDKNGNEVTPMTLEPKGLVNRTFVPQAVSVKNEPYAVCLEEGWAIPLKVSEKGNPTAIPLHLCNKCQSAMGYKLPVHMGSHLTCVVCPILEARQITQKRPDASKEDHIPSQGSSPTGSALPGELCCDYCFKEILEGEMIRRKMSDGETYQFERYVCLEEFMKRYPSLTVESIPNAVGLNDADVKYSVKSVDEDHPCDSFIRDEGRFCDLKPAKYVLEIKKDQRRLYFCTFSHLMNEKERREKAINQNEVIPFRKIEHPIALPPVKLVEPPKEGAISVLPDGQVLVLRERDPLDEIIEKHAFGTEGQ